MKNFKRISIISIIGLIAAGAGFWFMANRPILADNTPPRQSVTIEEGVIVSSVKATSRLEAESALSLAFDTPGTVAAVYVERGDTVQAGDPLLALDTATLELQLAQAQASLAQLTAPARPEDIAVARANLNSAQANLAKVMSGASAEDIASAEASVRGAIANYNNLAKEASDDELTVASATLRNAEVALQNAQWAYDAVAYVDNIGEMPQAAELQRATISYESALANYNLAVAGASDEQLRASWSQVEQAQAQLDKLLNGPSDEDIIIAQAQVTQAEAQLDKLLNGPRPEDVALAELQVEQARQNLTKATLYSPIDGTVTEVLVDAGEKANGPVIQLATLNDLRINVQIDEIDLPALKTGQPALITLDALPGQTLSGAVSDIAPAPLSNAAGVTSYEVTITLAEPLEQAKVGMTANVAVETARKENVVIIPANLVQVDAETGQTYVEIPGPDGVPLQREIVLGQRSNQSIEVISGLKAGDSVLVPLAKEKPKSSGGSILPNPGQGGPFRG